MSAKLTAQLRGVYYPVVGLLEGGGKVLLKGLLKRLIHWLIFHFPQVSLSEVLTIPFWDQVSCKFN